MRDQRSSARRVRSRLKRFHLRKQVASATMDTLILAGLLGVLILIWKQGSRRSVLAAWWIVLLLCAGLLKYHITSGLGLGLTW